MQFVFAIIGTLAVAISLIEIIAHLFGGLQTLRGLTGRLLGRSGPEETGIEQAMFWIRVLGLLLIGGAALTASFTAFGSMT